MNRFGTWLAWKGNTLSHSRDYSAHATDRQRGSQSARASELTYGAFNSSSAYTTGVQARMRRMYPDKPEAYIQTQTRRAMIDDIRSIWTERLQPLAVVAGAAALVLTVGYFASRESGDANASSTSIEQGLIYMGLGNFALGASGVEQVDATAPPLPVNSEAW